MSFKLEMCGLQLYVNDSFSRSLVVLNLFLKAVHIKAYCLDLLDIALFKAWQCILFWCYALGRSLNKSKLLAQEKVIREQNILYFSFLFLLVLGNNRLPQVTARRYQMYQLGDVHQTRGRFLNTFTSLPLIEMNKNDNIHGQELKCTNCSSWLLFKNFALLWSSNPARVPQCDCSYKLSLGHSRALSPLFEETL